MMRLKIRKRRKRAGISLKGLIGAMFAAAVVGSLMKNYNFYQNNNRFQSPPKSRAVKNDREEYPLFIWFAMMEYKKRMGKEVKF